MRDCFEHYCNKGKQTEWVDDGTEDGYIITTEHNCPTCEGTGEVGDECFCYARDPNECCCGAWDDIEEEWYECEVDDE